MKHPNLVKTWWFISWAQIDSTSSLIVVLVFGLRASHHQHDPRHVAIHLLTVPSEPKGVDRQGGIIHGALHVFKSLLGSFHRLWTLTSSIWRWWWKLSAACLVSDDKEAVVAAAL